MDCDSKFESPGKRPRCSECKRIWGNEVRRKAAINRKHTNRVRLWNYLKANPCVDCGEDDYLILQFDHRDQDLKVFGIKDSLDFSWERLKSEIEKCDVRCPNCHARRTKVQLNHWYPDYNVVIHDPYACMGLAGELPKDWVLILKY